MDLEKNRADCEKALGCWFLTGATASGKTDVALELAKRLDAEIISMDSMAIYRGMDIGTPNPRRSNRDMSATTCWIFVIQPKKFSVTQYREAALAAIDQIRGRGKAVLFVGGTALYLKAMICGIFQGPPADWEFRQAIEQEVAESGLEQLHQRLAQVDPISAHKIHPNDQRRLIRALEVYTSTGQPISHLQNEFEVTTKPDDCRVFTLRHPRAELHQRIDQRVGEMFERGLVEEVQRLLEQFEELGPTAAQAVGYQEVIRLIQSQSHPEPLTLEETHEKVLVRTRRFARHQETWFRGIHECRILDVDQTWDVLAIADALVEQAKSVRRSQFVTPGCISLLMAVCWGIAEIRG